MKLEVRRFGLGDDSTLGKLYIDGQFACFTLEDEGRKAKVPGETRIPEGHYEVTLRTVGGFHDRYSKSFENIHKGMLWVRDVPGFEYILVHCGNTDEDTSGCLLLGARPLVMLDGEFELRESQMAYKHTYPMIAKALLAKERVTILIRQVA
jgi:hypothetical protein